MPEPLRSTPTCCRCGSTHDATPRRWPVFFAAVEPVEVDPYARLGLQSTGATPGHLVWVLHAARATLGVWLRASAPEGIDPSAPDSCRIAYHRHGAHRRQAALRRGSKWDSAPLGSGLEGWQASLEVRPSHHAEDRRHHQGGTEDVSPHRQVTRAAARRKTEPTVKAQYPAVNSKPVPRPETTGSDDHMRPWQYMPRIRPPGRTLRPINPPDP